MNDFSVFICDHEQDSGRVVRLFQFETVQRDHKMSHRQVLWQKLASVWEKHTLIIKTELIRGSKGRELVSSWASCTKGAVAGALLDQTQSNLKNPTMRRSTMYVLLVLLGYGGVSASSVGEFWQNPSFLIFLGLLYKLTLQEVPGLKVWIILIIILIDIPVTFNNLCTTLQKFGHRFILNYARKKSRELQFIVK